jgi:hypothetical protein
MATSQQILRKELEQARAQQAQLPISIRISKIESALAALGGTVVKSHRRKMSAATRALLSAAARKRWSGKKSQSKS